MAHLIQSGDIFRPTPTDAVLREHLPQGVYTVEVSTDGYYFRARDPFRDLPPIYGDHSRWAKRILETFGRKDSNMGVLLSGEKGGGKSLLGKLVAREAAAQGIPTILVEAAHSPTDLGKLLAALERPAVVFIDEFEKTYSHQSTQEEFLTLLDGTSGIRHLFVFTVNNSHAVNGHMLNRPGRIHYRIDFEGLDESFIRSYCADELDYPEELEDILLIASCFERFNFDQLKTLVQEINDYHEPALEAVRLLNISPETVERDFALTVVNEQGELQQSHSSWRGNMLTAESIHIQHWPHGDRSWPLDLTLSRADAVVFDPKADVYSFRKNGLTVTLKGKEARQTKLKWWESMAEGSSKSTEES